MSTEPASTAHLAQGHVNLIVKVTRRCNLNCEYCGERRNAGSGMPFEVVAHLTAKALGEPALKSVNFIWHGGEPLVRGRRFYEKALRLQALACRDGRHVSNSVQTNGLLFDEAWADFFVEYGFAVGVSLDGPEVIHDAQRPTVRGGHSYKGAMRALELLRDRGASHGVLVVVTDRMLEYGADRVFCFFVEEGIRSIGLQRLRPRGVATDESAAARFSADALKYAAFLTRLFDLWLEHDDPGIHIREFDGVLDSLTIGRAGQCTLGGGCLGRHLSIDTNGDVFHCDRYVGDGDYRLGNVCTDDIRTMLASAPLNELRIRDEVRLATHALCPWFAECRGGCPHNDYIAAMAPERCEHACDTALLFDHIHGRMGKMLGEVLTKIGERAR